MTARLRHLNSISSCPLGGRLMDGRTPSVFSRGSLCCHCLLIEPSKGLVLVDTGFGLRDVANRAAVSPTSSWPCSAPTSARR